MQNCTNYKICSLQALPNDKYCILHSTDPNKDKNYFEKTLNNHIKNNWIMSGFIFPIKVDFSRTEITSHFDVRKAIFIYEADFSYCEFNEQVKFAGAEFNSNVIFAGAKFKKQCFFNKVKFIRNNVQEFIANFENVEFNSHVDFSNTKFDEVDFSGALFKNSARFYNTEFDSSAEFMSTKFEEVCSFNKVKFKSDVNFDDVSFNFLRIQNSSFSNQIIFQATLFSGNVVIENNTFEGLIEFNFSRYEKNLITTKNTFKDDINFNEVEFKGLVYFKDSTFEKGINLIKRILKNEVNFEKSIFNGELNFTETTFEDNLNFTEVNLNKKSIFKETTFKKKVFFDNVKFKEEADFTKSIFKEKVNFTTSIFEKEINFSESTFEKDVDFSKLEFKKVIFNKTKFENGADFTEVTFTENTNFISSTFKGGTTYFINIKSNKKDFNFKGAQFLNRIIFSNEDSNEKVFVDSEIDFRDIIIDPLKSLCFRNADLRKCQFLNTDLREIELTSVLWPRNTRNVVFDEIINTDKIPYDRVERLYRELKINYENRKDFPIAGEFHLSEKEMKFKNKTTKLGDKFLLGSYWLFSSYGERVFKPFVFLIILLLISTFSYILLGSKYPDCEKLIKAQNQQIRNIEMYKEVTLPKTQTNEIKNKNQNEKNIRHKKTNLKKENELIIDPDCGRKLSIDSIKDLGFSFLHSIRTMLLMKTDIIKLNNYGYYVQTIEVILSSFFLALLALSLRQRLKRF